MSVIVALCCLGVLQGENNKVGPMSGEQFVRVLRELHASINDVSFTYEGVFESTPPAPMTTHRQHYQAYYVYRKDGASFLDVYLRQQGAEVELFRLKHTSFKGQLMELTHNPDSGFEAQLRSRGDAGGFGLNGTASAQRFLYLWFFRSVDDPKSRGFVFEGLDQVGDHACLRIKMNYFPGEMAVGPTPTIRLWIDVARGGHVLKAESELEGKLAWRTHGIQLDKFADGQNREVWLPVDGRTDFYQFGQENYSKPVVTETYHVVGSSVQINRGLSDEVFAIGWEPRLRSSDELSRWKSEFRQIETNRRKNRSRSDPEGVTDRLNKDLAEADRQAKMIEASSPSRQWLRGPQILQ